MTPANETIRVADQAIADWLSGLHVDYGNNVFPNRDLRDYAIFRVFAAPERAFAEMRYLLIQQGFITANNDETEDHTVSDDELYKQIPMPFCRIQRGDIAPVTELHSTPNEFITASAGLAFTRSRWPTPYEISYTVEFVSKTRYTDNFITEWMIGQFTPLGMGVNQRLIPATFPDPYGVKSLTLAFTGTSDASELEVSGPTDRKIRTAFSLSLRVWDMDLVGRTVKAITSVTTDYRAADDADVSVGDFGSLIESVSGKPVKVYHTRPVPERHSSEHTTAAKGAKYDDAPQQYVIDNDSDGVETAGIPFHAVDIAQGAVRVRWRRVDGVKPAGNLRAQILWRNSQNAFAPTVLNEIVLPYSDSGTVVDYQSVPGSEFNELSIRFLRPAAGPNLVVAMREQIVYRVPQTNAVAAPDRNQGPGLGAVTDVTVISLARTEAYIVRGFVEYGAQPVTIQVFADAPATELLATRTFTANGEFAVVVSPNNSQLFLIRISTATPDSALEVTGITVSRCRSRPLLMP